MRKTRKKLLLLALTALLSFALAAPGSAVSSAVTTVEKIPQSTAAALTYQKNNVGTPNATYTIPGLMCAVTRSNDGSTVEACTGMVPQAMTFAGDGKYLLISAYCSCGSKHRTVLYMLDGKTMEYLSTVILDSCMHAGGIAWYGDYIWVCDTSAGKILRAYKYESALNSLQVGYATAHTAVERTVAVTPSYLCRANDMLYVGAFGSDSNAEIHYYTIHNTELTEAGMFTVNGVSKIQGISIRGDHMVLTSSYGRTNASNVYVFTDKNGHFQANREVYHVTAARSYKFANMAEGCYIGSTYTYFLFESGAKAYRESDNTRPLDQFIRYKSADIGAG